MSRPGLIPLPGFREYPEDVMRLRAHEFRDDLRRRRTVRDAVR